MKLLLGKLALHSVQNKTTLKEELKAKVKRIHVFLEAFPEEKKSI